MKILRYPCPEPSDGGFSGFLCAVFEAFFQKLEEASFMPSQVYQEKTPGVEFQSPGLFDEITDIPFSPSRAERVSKWMLSRFTPAEIRTVFLSFLSDHPQKDSAIYQCLRLAVKTRDRNLFSRLDNVSVHRMVSSAGRTGKELHLFYGILRFSFHGSFYYAPIKPSCDLLPLLSPHFTDRFADQDWVIHDLKRQTALFWIKGRLYFKNGVDVNPGLTGPDGWEGLWKTYFNVIPIKERVNPNLQRNFVPIKYRARLTEFLSSEPPA